MSLTPAKTIDFTVQIIVEPDQGGFHAYCPALKGLHVDGATEEEALQNARIAAILYLRSLIKHGDPIPIGITVTKTSSKTRQRSESSIHEHIAKLHIDDLQLTSV